MDRDRLSDLRLVEGMAVTTESIEAMEHPLNTVNEESLGSVSRYRKTKL